jgi:hypothetical protein
MALGVTRWETRLNHLSTSGTDCAHIATARIIVFAVRYAKGDRVELRDSTTGVIVTEYESTRAYGIALDGEPVYRWGPVPYYRSEKQIRRCLDDCRCGHRHAGLCTRCDCVRPQPERMSAWMFVVFMVSLIAAPLKGTASD